MKYKVCIIALACMAGLGIVSDDSRARAFGIGSVFGIVFLTLLDEPLSDKTKREQEQQNVRELNAPPVKAKPVKVGAGAKVQPAQSQAATPPAEGYPVNTTSDLSLPSFSFPTSVPAFTPTSSSTQASKAGDWTEEGSTINLNDLFNS